MKRRLRTLRRLLREGDREALQQQLTRGVLPAAVFRRNALAIVRVQEVRALPRPLASLVVRWGGPEDEGVVQALRPRPGGYGALFARGHGLIVGHFDGEPATCNWVERGARHVSAANGYDFALDRDAAWVFGMEVAPKFRMSGAFHRHWREAVALLRADGVERVYGAVQADNPRSLNSHLRLGFAQLWDFRVTRALGLTRFTARPVAGGAVESGWGTWHGRDPS